MTEKWNASAPKKGTDEYIVWEAKKRFAECQEWESQAEQNGDEDERFANGDAVNMYQWPATVLSVRQPAGGAAQPCLTINKTRQHCLQIINDARQNKSSVKVVAVGDGATTDAAQVYMGVIRHIENLSNATAAYDNATWGQVIRGIGYWRVLTDYAHDGTDNQEIFIRRIPNPKSVKLDPHIQEADGSDARFGFVFVDVPRDQFEDEYPDIDLALPGIDDKDGWISKDTVRKAEYYRKITRNSKLWRLKTGEIIKEADLPEGITEPPADLVARMREVPITTVEHYTIGGNKIIDRAVGEEAWPGKYIPIVRVVGEETVIDGRLDRKGHVRALLDPQRMYNYWSSAATEHVALQTKVPWIVDPQAIEGATTYWDTANTVNYSWLPAKTYGDDGQKLNPPSKTPPPIMPEAYLHGLQTTAQEMMMVSGQWQAEMGMPSNERSGVAIERRQRQAENSTYHFVDRQAQAIRFTGKILIDLIPKVYDVPRVVRILNEDGSDDHVQIDPNAPQAHQEAPAPDPSTKARVIFNPSVGQYAVEADIGPAFATQRQEGFQALTTVLSQSKELAPFIADIWMKMGDFPGADEISKRLRAMVPPQAMADGDPAMQAMQQQTQQAMQHAGSVIEKLTQELAALKMQKRREDESIIIDAHKANTDEYRAFTDRLKVAMPDVGADTLRPIIAQLMLELMQPPASPDTQGMQGTQPQMMPQMPAYGTA